MMTKRLVSYLGMALAMCLGSFAAHAVEQVSYVVAQVGDGSSYAAKSLTHNLTLTQWRQGSQSGDSSPASNLISLSNHFGMASAAPFGDEMPDTITA